MTREERQILLAVLLYLSLYAACVFLPEYHPPPCPCPCNYQCR